MKKVEYDKKPLKLEAVGNGSYLYRWDIQEIEKTNEDGSKTSLWECNEALSWKNTRKAVTEAAIDMLRESANNEAKLINDYNAAVSGLLDKSYKKPYLDYIKNINDLKSEIKTFFGE